MEQKNYLDKDAALSQANTKFDSIATRQIAVLVGDGFSMKNFEKMKQTLEKEGAIVKLVAPHGGKIMCDDEMEHKVDAAIMTTESVLYDAIYIPGGNKSIAALKKEAKFTKFVNEAFKHCKAIAADDEGELFIDTTFVSNHKDDAAILINSKPKDFVDAIAKHRNWDRMNVAEKVPS